MCQHWQGRSITTCNCQKQLYKNLQKKLGFKLDCCTVATSLLEQTYGRLHRGREMTPIELEFFSFALKPLNWWINFQTLRNLFCVSINTTWRSSSFLFTCFTCWTWLKQPLNLASHYIFWNFVSLLLQFQLIWKNEHVFKIMIWKELCIIFPKHSLHQ